jgi:predicted transcriptional regulator
MNDQQKIISALRDAPDGLTGSQLQQSTGLWSMRLYTALITLEANGSLKSRWIDGSYPRRRLYHLREDEHGKVQIGVLGR